MTRFAFLLYGLVAYLLFFAALLYAIGFVGNVVVPKGIDDGVPTSLGAAVAIDVFLLALFAIQHNVMARPWFKEWWIRFVPQPIERSTFVAISSLLLMLLYWQWRPIPGIAWEFESGLVRGVLWALYIAGWVIVFYSSFVIDHFELFGLKQVYRHFRGLEDETAPFSERSLYRWVRHPLMLGFILAFWSAPTMSWGRLLFAAVTTVWILIAIKIEERDLASFLGEPYVRYRARTPMLVPGLRFGRSGKD
jgi:protein-S-isoprenylcysteine O-methyltransferase Ste14